jgi:hypothetical protein
MAFPYALRARCDNQARTVAVFVNSFFEERVQRLFELAGLVEKIFASAGVEYRIAGGLAAYLYVEQAEPDAGRLTKDIDIAVRRQDLEKIAKAAEPFGLEYRHVAGVDMLVQADQPSARRAVHFVFAGEKVRPEYSDAVPELGSPQLMRGLRVMPLADLVRMKLTSFRLVDATHVKDLDRAGLITQEIESSLPPALRERLAQVRARE